MPFTRQNEFEPGLPPAEYALPEAPSAEFMDIPKAFGAGIGEGTHSIGEGLQENSKKIAHNVVSHPLDNPTNAITGEVILKAIRQKQKARLKKERGLVLSRKDEHLRTLGRFGSYDPVL